MSVLILILKLYPLIMATIQEIETTAQVAKTGPAKLQLLTGVVQAALQADPVPALLAPEKLLAVIGAITSQTVAFYNLVGVFRKSS